MLQRNFGLALAVTVSAVVACSNVIGLSDYEIDPKLNGGTSGSSMAGTPSSGGSASGGTSSAGNMNGGTTTGGTTSGGSATGGTTSGGTTSGGTTSGGSLNGGTTSGGSQQGGTSPGGSGGTTTGNSCADLPAELLTSGGFEGSNVVWEEFS